MSMLSPKIQNLTRQLLDLEAAQDKACEADVEVVVRVIEELRARLIRLAGVEGFRSLLARALTLAKVESPLLNGVHISASGSLEGFEGTEENPDAQQSGIRLVGHLLELLVTFIGAPLTLHLVRDAWPEASMPEASMDKVDFRAEDTP